MTAMPFHEEPRRDTKAHCALAIHARDLHRTYGTVHAVAGIDLDVAPGEVVAILGPNGAGKTTLVEILEGLRRRDRGTVDILGQDPEHADATWRSRVGAVLQLGTETDEFTVDEMVRAHAAYYPSPRPVADLIADLELSDLVDRRVRHLSGGQRRRLDLALGVVGDPELLFLDEPTTGLDPEARRSIWQLIQRLADTGTTVVLTTHYLDEVEHLAHRTIVLVDGKAVWTGTTADLRNGDTTSIVSFELHPTVHPYQLPPDLPGDRAGADNPDIRFETDDPTGFVTALMAWAAVADPPNPIQHLQITRPSLEDIYLDLLDTTHPATEERP